MLMLVLRVLLQGCGVVEFETPEQAQEAIRQFNGFQVRGCGVLVLAAARMAPGRAGGRAWWWCMVAVC